MYLTRLFLDPTARSVRADVANPDGLHKTVMRLFPKAVGPEPRKEHGVLHRIDESPGGRVMLLIQSRPAPNLADVPPNYLADLASDPDLLFSGIGQNPDIRDVHADREAIVSGDRFHFRLRANTTRKILTKSGVNGERNNGKRVPVRGDEARLEWLGRHARVGGFSVADVRVSEVGPRGRKVTVAGALFDGWLTVTEPASFRATLESGVGPAKAFGFGLLSIRRMV